MIFYWLIIILCIILDQASKALLISHFQGNTQQYIEIASFCNLISIWNHGISFGLMSSYQNLGNSIFMALNLCILVYMMISIRKRWFNFGVAMCVGGGFGNIIDRVFRGAVFDFIHLHYRDQYAFAVFNLADFFITTGGIIAILIFNRSQTKEEKKR